MSETKMKRMYFNGAAEVPPGFSTTVRRGDKWRESAMIGSEIELWAKDASAPFATATITATMTLASLAMIPFQVLEMNHNPEARTLDGLVSELNRVYGGGWDPTELTVVFLLV